MAITTKNEDKWIATRLEELQTSQASWASLYQKYQQLPKTTIGEITIEVHELKAPNQEMGYVVYLFKTVVGVTYVCSYGFGGDSVIHTRDWAVYDPTKF